MQFKYTHVTSRSLPSTNLVRTTSECRCLFIRDVVIYIFTAVSNNLACVSVIADSVKCRFNAVQYIMVLYTPLRSQMQNIN